MAFLTPDKTFDLNGVTVNEYLLTIHNPNGIDMPWAKLPDKIYGVTIHNTDYISVSEKTTPAEQYTRATVNGNMGDVRVHYYVDNKCAWQNLPWTLTGWHAADGNGPGNMKTIAIECIMSSDYDDWDKKSEDNCAKLAAGILKAYGLKIDRLFTHSDWYSGKRCPAYILPHWEQFKKKVEGYMQDPVMYYVRKDFHDTKSQIGSYKTIANAKAACKPFYKVFDKNGKIVYVPVLDTSGYKKNDKTIGSLCLKELLLLAKELKIQPRGMDENRSVGPGTINAINYLLESWGYDKTSIAGDNFAKLLTAEIMKKLPKKVKAFPTVQIDSNGDGKIDVRDLAYTSQYGPALDKTGFKKGDKTIGSLYLKEMLLVAKALKMHSNGMVENREVGSGTLRAINSCLSAWGYNGNSLAGEKFIMQLAKSIKQQIKNV